MIGYMIQLLVFSRKYILFCVGNLDLEPLNSTLTLFTCFSSVFHIYIISLD